MARFPAFHFAALPDERLSAALGLIVPPGEVILSGRAHRHVAVEHPADHAACLLLLGDAPRDPDFTGRAPHHGDDFEPVYDPAGLPAALLIAVGPVPDADGLFHIRSFYLLERRKVRDRIRAGRLRPVPP